MPFGTCRVYEYGCLAPVQGEKELIKVILKRNHLWNKLVEIDRLFEQRYSEVIGKELFALEREVAFLRDFADAFREEVRRLRQKVRAGKISLPERMERDFQRVKSCLREKSAEYKEAKKRVRDASRDALEALEAERREAVRKTLHSLDLWWCNRDEERTKYENARKRVFQDRAKGRPVSLQFHPFDGSGKVTVRLRERGMAGPWGMPTENVFKPNNAFWIEPVPPEAWENPVRAVRRRASRTTVHFRVGSDGRDPVWVVLPMVMHRPLPENGIVRQASVVRKRVGRAFRYKLVITVEIPETKILFHKEGVVAVDLGWRKVEGRVRVAYWADDKGNYGQLVLPDRMIQAFQKLRDLRSIRDVYFDPSSTVHR